MGLSVPCGVQDTGSIAWKPATTRMAQLVGLPAALVSQNIPPRMRPATLKNKNNAHTHTHKKWPYGVGVGVRHETHDHKPLMRHARVGQVMLSTPRYWE